LEAILGAIYLDGGFEAAYNTIARLFGEDMSHIADRISKFDSKTRLQERTQSQFKTIPQYLLIKEEGPDHDKRFVVEVQIKDEKISEGFGRSKKEAEQNAASEAIKQLSIRGDI